jgi:hypothetical protein
MNFPDVLRRIATILESCGIPYADGFDLFIASAEDVILAKMEWSKLGGSQRQIQDSAQILKVQWQS